MRAWRRTSFLNIFDLLINATYSQAGEWTRLNDTYSHYVLTGFTAYLVVCKHNLLTTTKKTKQNKKRKKEVLGGGGGKKKWNRNQKLYIFTTTMNEQGGGA